MRKLLAVLALLLPLAADAGTWDNRTLEPDGTSTFSWLSADTGDQQALHLGRCTTIAYSVQTYDAIGPTIELYLVPAENDGTSLFGTLIGSISNKTLQLSPPIPVGPYYLRPKVVASGGDVGTISVRCMGRMEASDASAALAVLPLLSTDAKLRGAADHSAIINLGVDYPGYMWIGQDAEGDYLPFGGTSSSVATTGTAAAIPATCGAEGALYVANDLLTLMTPGLTGGGTQHVLFQCDTNGAATDTWKRVWDSPHLWWQVHSGTVGTFQHTLEGAADHAFGHAIRQQLDGNGGCLQSTYKGGKTKQPLMTGDGVVYLPMGGQVLKDPDEDNLDDVDYLVGVMERGKGANIVRNSAAASAVASLNAADIGNGFGVMTYRGDWYGWVVRSDVATVTQFPCSGNDQAGACMGTDDFDGWNGNWAALARFHGPKPTQQGFPENRVDFAFKVGTWGYVFEPPAGEPVGSQNPWFYAGVVNEVPGSLTYTPVVAMCQHSGATDNIYARLERLGWAFNFHDWH